jgi:excisionase family DNA binding protein
MGSTYDGFLSLKNQYSLAFRVKGRLRMEENPRAARVNMEALYTVDELAQVLKVTPVWIYKLIREGKIPFVRMVGKAVRFRESDIEQWLSEGRNRAYHRDQWRRRPENAINTDSI